MYPHTQCTSTRTGKPLNTYQCSFSAQQAADQVKINYGRDMVPYPCNRCAYWHLSPKDRHTPSETCYHCTSSEGKLKQLYKSHEAAQKRADCLREERGLTLYIYACPHHDGWHLTKSCGR